MQKRNSHALPFLVTLAGCVLMLAWVDPANASEVTRQLTQKGYAISQLRKSEVAIVKNANTDVKVFFKGIYAAYDCTACLDTKSEQQDYTNYSYVFPHFVKSSLQDDILTWMKRE